MAAVADVQVVPLSDVQVAPLSSERRHGVDARLGRALVQSKRKRLFDVVIASAALIVLAPVLGLIALAVVIEGGWPPLYPQERIGLGGRPFTLWKFRTMVRHAHGMRDSLLVLNERPFPAFKIKRDPRVTRLGRLLRKSSLDELPQLWNVVRGEMSLVGPRPSLPEEVAHYDGVARERLSVRPGITGLWQVDNRCRPERNFSLWIAKDIQYINEWSMARDVALLCRTISVVARMSGE